MICEENRILLLLVDPSIQSRKGIPWWNTLGHSNLWALRGCFEILWMAFQLISRRLGDVKTQGIAPLCLAFLPRRSTR